MTRSQATTVAAYLADLPPDRRSELEAVRRVILEHLPVGYEEAMRWGMISYEVPLATYPHTYNGQPLLYAALAAQKRYNTLHLMGAYAGGQREPLERSFAAAGIELDMGQGCIHFQTARDLPLDRIGELIAAIPPEQWVEIMERSRKG